jgi:outer membrane cobalamin receptor
VTAPALAHDTGAAADTGELEQVVVTGSRIRHVDAEAASPVLTPDREAITEQGVSTLGDLLHQIPAVSGAGAATNSQIYDVGGARGR